jgi:hypothetical protein
MLLGGKRSVAFRVSKQFAHVAMSTLDTLESARNNKRRWSREEKRLHNREHKQKEKAGKPEPLTLPERLLACAEAAERTHAVLIRHGADDDERQMRVVTTSNLFVQSEAYRQDEGTQITVKPLLILDLNGILCHRIRKGRPDPYPHVTYRSAVETIANTPVIVRPDIDLFLNSLDAHFCLAIWTSAKAKTAKLLLRVLLPESIHDKLLFVWSQNHCQVIHSSEDDGEPIFVKSLAKVWHQYPLWNASNTLLVDDSPEKCPEENNTLHPPPLHGKVTDASEIALSDAENGKIQREFFSLVAQQHFCQPRVSWPESDDRDVLLVFLQSHAVNHMGWRGSLHNNSKIGD